MNPHIAAFRKKRNELKELVKRFRKGDAEAQAKLQELFQDPQYREVFSKTFRAIPEAMARQAKRAQEERIYYKSDSSRPYQGGAPGLGKKA